MRTVSLFVLLAAGLALSAEPNADPKTAKAATHEIKIVGMKFVPDAVTVKVGDTVVWKNADVVPHNIFAPQVSSSPFQPGESFTWKATKAGDIAYSCALHPMMHATLTVK